MDRPKLQLLTDELIRIHAELEAMYLAELDSSKLAQRLRLPLNANASTLEVACQAIDDAMNVLTLGFTDAD